MEQDGLTKEPRLQRIAPDELPDLLKRLDFEQTTELALIGPSLMFSASSDEWPEVLQVCCI